MNRLLLFYINSILKNKRRIRQWRRVVTALAAVIVFCTTYALILPAISVEKNNTEKVSGLYVDDAEEVTGNAEELTGNAEEVTRDAEDVTGELDYETDETAPVIEEEPEIEFEPEPEYTYVGEADTVELSGGEESCQVRVTCEAATGIPESASLNVREIVPDSDAAEAGELTEYDAYLGSASETLGCDAGSFSYVRFFDISIVDEYGQEIEPITGTTVDVRIALMDMVDDSENLSVIHFANESNTGDVLETIVASSEESQIIEFQTDGFSVYALVDARDAFVPEGQNIKTVDDINANLDKGFLLSYSSNIYFTSGLNNKGCLKESNNKDDAAEWYLEKVDGTDNQYLIYTYVNGTKQYIKQRSGNEITLDANGGTAIEISSTGNNGKFYLKHASQKLWLQHSNGGGGIRFWGDNNNDTNSQISFTVAHPDTPPDDYYGLNGKTYGIAYDSGSIFCTALMAEDTGSGSLAGQDMSKLDTQGYEDRLFVPVTSDITEWTFELIEGDIYHVKATVEGEEKYLTIENGSVTLRSEPTEGSNIKIGAGADDHEGFFTFSSGGYYLTLSGTEGNHSYSCTTDSSANGRWLKLAEKSPLSNDDNLIYTAQKISVSDPVDEVILYTRVWNGEKYDFYAVDYDGSLIPCYDDGDVIKWVGNQYQTAVWKVTDHVGKDTHGNIVKNGYYELQNTYTGKYIKPLLGDNTLFSDNEAFLNMDGRYYQEEYTKIKAWDDTYYSYIGLAVDLENNRVVPCPSGQAEDFYFARVKASPAQLTKVDTIDNNEFGITMKMIDFNNPIVGDRDSKQSEYLGRNSDKTGLLSTDIKGDGYPLTHLNKSLGGLYESKPDGTPYEHNQTVNHLFIKSVYEESGYFEFDSTENFAQLNGNRFDVYDQLGTVERPGNHSTMKHGQFMPYNSLIDPATGEPWPYSDMYSNTTTVTGDPMSSDTARYGEGLHEIPQAQADYFFGMEMSAEFTQTPSGLDAWGHDIIFEFSGDDDFWFYVDDELVLDLGGVHSAMTGSVNFRTGTVVTKRGKTETTQTLREIFTNNYKTRNPSATVSEINAYLDQYFEPGSTVFRDYTTHKMQIYYMERGAGASNLHMRFNLTAVKQGEVTLSKKVTGSSDVDYDLMEFPYQILYHLDSDEEGATWRKLAQNQSNPTVTYQGSKRPVKYLSNFTPVGESTNYQNVFFLKPGEKASINMPDNVTEYKIAECGVNMNIFKSVKANSTTLSGENDQGRHDYETSPATVEDRPNVEFENEVDPDSLRTLTITKQLWDENGYTVVGEGTPTEHKEGNQLIGYDDDEATFDLRVFMSSQDSSVLTLVRNKTYYVKDPENNYCRWNADTKRFVSLGISDYADLVTHLETCTPLEKSAIIFETSNSGAVSKIPGGFSVEFRGLPVDSAFKVEERENEIPEGYRLVEYERDKGSFIAGDEPNTGIIRANEDPHILVNNKRGWGLTVDKIWSDADYMDSHDEIYFAVYVKDPQHPNNPQLVPGTVRGLVSPNTSLYYYFDELLPGKTFEDYEIYEVRLTHPDDENESGTAVNYSSIHILHENDTLRAGGTPHDKEYQKHLNYKVSYTRGEPIGTNDNVRKDSVTNTRKGIRLVKTDWNGDPLPGAEFVLKDKSGTIIGNGSHVSTQDGYITTAYLDQLERYTLEEISTPSGFKKPSVPWRIYIDHNGDVQVTGEDGNFEIEFQGTHDESAIIKFKNKGFSLQAIKVNEDNTDTLAGAAFALYDQVPAASGHVKNQNPMPGFENLETGEDGILPNITSALPAGVYYLSEVRPPNGYKKLDGDLVFVVKSDGTVEIPAHVVSDDSGQVIILNNLEGSHVQDWISSTVADGHVTYTIRIPNEPAGIPVRIVKTDQTGAPLEGAEFSISGEEITDEEGLISTKEEGGRDAVIYYNAALPIGTYTLTETHAPSGYLTPDSPTIITVENTDSGIVAKASANGKEFVYPQIKYDRTTGEWTITIINQMGYELPASGGPGTRFFRILGCLLIAGAGILLMRRKILRI